MTESQIENRVEHLFDALDRQLMAGRMTQAEYDREAGLITTWADQMYAEGARR